VSAPADRTGPPPCPPPPVSSSERPTAPTGLSPPAILPDTVPYPGGLWAQLLPVARVQVTLPARYEVRPLTRGVLAREDTSAGF